jgi:hypothetical protein
VLKGTIDDAVLTIFFFRVLHMQIRDAWTGHEGMAPRLTNPFAFDEYTDKTGRSSANTETTRLAHNFDETG